MKFIEIFEDSRGAISSLMLSSGEEFTHWTQLRDYAKDHKEIVYTEGVHKLYVALKGEKERPRILASKESGLVLKVKYKNLTIVDLSQWEMNLRLDERSFKLLQEMEDNYGEIFATPSRLVSHNYHNKAGRFLVESLRKRSPRLIEAYLSSSKLPLRIFKPAYGGGILACPADSYKVYNNVKSYDINSSYPWSALACEVPVTKGIELFRAEVTSLKIEEDGSLYVGEKTGFIGLFTLRNFRRKDWVKLPLIRGEDAELVRDLVTDELGILSGTIQISLTPYELKAIKLQYDIESIEIVSMTIHGLGKVPRAAREFIQDSFDKKNSLDKNDPNRIAAKTALNTIIGFWGVDPFKSMARTKMIDGVLIRAHEGMIADAFETYSGSEDRVGFTSGRPRSWDFRWAVYALSHARLRLIEAEKALYDEGLEVLYSDTDSIKVSGDSSSIEKVFSELNRKRDEEFSYKGMGQWEDETEGFTTGVFIGLKVYVLENPMTRERSVRAAGVDRKLFEKTLENKTINEIAAQDFYAVTLDGRAAADLEDKPFGCRKGYVLRQITKKYGNVDIANETN